jgi:hypothetical protein
MVMQWNLVWLAMSDFFPARSQYRSAIAASRLFDRFEVFVGERLVNERPEMFSGLKFRGARRLVDESDPIRNRQVFGSVPAGIIELKHGKHWLTVAKQAEKSKAHTG